MSSAPWGLLDDSALPLFVWMFWVRHCKFDYLLHECVTSVPIAMVDNVIGTGFADGAIGARLYDPVRTVVNSPTDFGVPCDRRRRYSSWKLSCSEFANVMAATVPQSRMVAAPQRCKAMVAVPHSDVVAVPQISVGMVAAPQTGMHMVAAPQNGVGIVAAPQSCLPQSGASGSVRADGSLRANRDLPARAVVFGNTAMQTMFYRRLVASSKIYLAATPKQVHEYYCKRAQSRSFLGSKNENGLCIDVLDLIPPCARAHLQSCREMRAAALANGKPAPDIICLMQSPHHISPNTLSIVPALLTRALPFSLASSRLLLPDELMLAMGMPSPLLAELLPAEAARCAFQPPLTDILSEAEVRKLIGNGMHISQVGSAILLLLCESALA